MTVFCLISLLVGTPLPLTLIAPPTLDRHSDIIIIIKKIAGFNVRLYKSCITPQTRPPCPLKCDGSHFAF